jgi:hypothetical protein
VVSRGGVAALVLILLTSLASAIEIQGAYYAPGASGYDVSFPQCSSRFPKDGSFGIVGVNNGLPWSQNPCLGAQITWAEGMSAPMAFYVNTVNPGPQSSYWNLVGPKSCDGTLSLSCSYNYGWNAANQAFGTVVSLRSQAVAESRYWWIDLDGS